MAEAESPRRGSELFERAAKLARLGQYDYAADLFFICVSSDPGNLRYVQGLIETLHKKFGSRRNIGPMAIFKTLGAGDALDEAIERCDWVEVTSCGLNVLMVNPWDAPALEALAVACDNMAGETEGSSPSQFAACASYYRQRLADLPHPKKTAVSKSPRQAGGTPNTMPSDGIPGDNAPPSAFPYHWMVLGLIVLTHAVFCAYCTPTNKTLASLTVGVMISQPVLLAIWAAFAHQKFYFRVLWSLLLCTYLSFADDLGIVQEAMHAGSGTAIIANLTLFVVTLFILLLIGRFSPWQITVPEGEDPRSMFRARNYGIHHLLVLTAIVALACGLIRSLIQMTDSGFPYSSVGDFVGTLGVLLVAALPACIVPWLVLKRRHKRITVACATFFIVPIAVVLDLVAWYVMALNIRSSWGWSSGDELAEAAIEFLSMQFGAVISALVAVLVMRWSGFRMVSEGPKPKT